MSLGLTRAGALLAFSLCAGCAGDHELDERAASEAVALADYGDLVAWSAMPPGLQSVDAPQFVAVTFDDNFVSGLDGPEGGMTWATDFLRSLENPAGSAVAGTYDGRAVRTTFFDNCVYLADASTREAWTVAVQDGHEIGNHTSNHPHGASFSAEDWINEVSPCTAALTDAASGVGLSVEDVRGFRSPYLEYSAALFGTLKSEGLEYDTSVQSCWGPGDDGTNCAWPYTLNSGSRDADTLSTKFGAPSVPSTAGLWEVPPSALFIPPDELSAKYGFPPGLRQRIPTDMPAPSFYEPATGRIAPLDITLFVDAGMSADEVLATLEYTLDLRIVANRAPLVFIAHTHVYASNYGAASQAPDVGERQRAIEAFVAYALSKPIVRMRPLTDILAWMRNPLPLHGVVTMPIMDGGPGADASDTEAGPTGGAGAMDAGVVSGGSPSGGAAGHAGGAEPRAARPSAASGCSCSVPRAKSNGLDLLFACALLAMASARSARSLRAVRAR